MYALKAAATCAMDRKRAGTKSEVLAAGSAGQSRKKKMVTGSVIFFR